MAVLNGVSGIEDLFNSASAYVKTYAPQAIKAATEKKIAATQAKAVAIREDAAARAAALQAQQAQAQQKPQMTIAGMPLATPLLLVTAVAGGAMLARSKRN